MSLTLKPQVRVRAKISSVGAYVPPKLLTNADLEKMVATNDQWITERTGIRERHIVEPGVATSDLAVEAAQVLPGEARGSTASEVEVIIVATVTPDMFFPATACLVQDKIGAKGAWGFDLSAACSGFPYALQVGAKLVESGEHKKVMVIGADVMSSIIDYTDRATCVIFGDGAGAVLLEPCEDGEIGTDRLLPRDRWVGCGGAEYAGRRESASFDGGDGGGEDALCAPGWAGGVQVCGAQDGGGGGDGADAQWRDGHRIWAALFRTRRTSGLFFRRRSGWGCRRSMW